MAKRIALLAALLVFIVAGASALNPVGTWVGSYKFDMSKIKMPTDPQQKKVAQEAINAIKAMKFTFVLRSDKSFRMEMRSVQAGKPRVQVSEGKYTFSANKVVTTTLKRDGKAVPTNDQTQNTLMISADGNTMVHTKTDPQLRGHLELKRAKK